LRHRVVTRAVHDAGSRILLQLLHSGRYGTHSNIVAPSPIKSGAKSRLPRTLDAADIGRTVADFVNAALLAKSAGYDGVEIMGSEGYLINQFLAPRTNQRQDRWGGSIENRMRIACDIVRETRTAAGRDFVIMYRISALDLVEGGQTGAEILSVAAAIEAAGATLLSTGFGWHESRVPTIAQPVPRAGFSWAVRRIKEVVKIPVIASNRINAPEVAEAVLARGDADMVAMARAMLADGEFANKAKAGDRAGINICIACNQACLDHYLNDRTANCVVNPRAGRETRLVYLPALTQKTIAVVGGGPAGLSCAAVAAERGHHVVLFERAGELGGQFNLAKRIPGKQEFAESIAYYAERVRRAGVEVRLGAWATDADVASFDEIVMATGVVPRQPAIPGIELGHVMSYVDLLRGNREIGKNIVIIGAGGIAIDVALFLVGRSDRSTLDPVEFNRHWGITDDRDASGSLRPGGADGSHVGCEITILKRSSTPFGSTLGRSTGWAHRATLARHGVRTMIGVEYRKIDAAGVHITAAGRETLVPADTIVVCAGQNAYRPLSAEAANVRLIGGASESSELDAERAMLQGAELAARL
jgi:2,4-dienoyl-CoA reductase (NADPH2)